MWGPAAGPGSQGGGLSGRGCVVWRSCEPPVRGRCCLTLPMLGDSAMGLGALEPLLSTWEGAVQGVQGQEEIAEGTLEIPVGRATFHPGPGPYREAESPG